MKPMWRYYVYAYRQFGWVFEKEFETQHEAIMFIELDINEKPHHRWAYEIVRDGKDPISQELENQIFEKELEKERKALNKIGQTEPAHIGTVNGG